MSSKKYVVEIWGEKVILATRQFVVEVPDDATEEDIQNVDVAEFDAIDDQPFWDETPSEGFVAILEESPEVIRVAGEDEVIHARFIRNDDGELVLDE